MQGSGFHFVIMFGGRCMGLTPCEADAQRQVDIYGTVVSDVYKNEARENGNPQAYYERVEGLIPYDYMGACDAHTNRLQDDARNYAQAQLVADDEIDVTIELDEVATFETSQLELDALREAMGQHDVRTGMTDAQSTDDEDFFGEVPTKSHFSLREQVSDSGFYAPAKVG